MPGKDLIHLESGSSAMYYAAHRYKHIVVDEAQDLSPAHGKMLRAMPTPAATICSSPATPSGPDSQVALGAVGINIRGRAPRLTLGYRTTKETLAGALTVRSGRTFDDLDDGTHTLAGYRSVLHGPDPRLVLYDTWAEELEGLATSATPGECSSGDHCFAGGSSASSSSGSWCSSTNCSIS